MPRSRTHSSQTREAARLLGARIRLARQQRRWTQAELARRIGVTAATIGKVERGDPSVSIGTTFEAAVITGVTLFHDEAAERAASSSRVAEQLALLPATARARRVDDDF